MHTEFEIYLKTQAGLSEEVIRRVSDLAISKTLRRNEYKFNGKELDTETGLYYYGARYYDPRTSIWLSTDPLMEMYPNVNPYAYCLQNPINYTDPTGMSVEGDEPPSTHTDKNGNIIAVYNDGDLGVYKHGDNADGGTPTKANIDKRHEKSTSAGGTKMGETEFWDEFIAPGNSYG